MEIESKVCKKCGYDKPISEFSIKNKNRSQPYNSRCKSCINADRREKFASGKWAKQVSEPDSHRERYLGKEYGISCDDYDAMYHYQHGRCGICGVHQNELAGRLHVDHDHDTGDIRALLCGNCNRGLGMYQDDPFLMEIAAEYLRSHGK